MIGDLDQAQRAIAWQTRAGDRLRAAQSGADLGFLFGKVQRFEDVGMYLGRPLEELETLGPPGAEMAAQIRRYLEVLPS
jgi:hypothetical protein